MEENNMLEQKLKKIVEKANKLKTTLKESINISGKESLVGSYTLLNESGVDEFLTLNIVIDNSKWKIVITNEDDIRILESLIVPDYDVIKGIQSFLSKKDYFVDKPYFDPLNLIDKLY